MALPNQDHNIAYSSQTLAKQVLENTSARVVLLVGAKCGKSYLCEQFKEKGWISWNCDHRKENEIESFLESRLSNQQRVILHCVQWESSHDAILPENIPIVPFV